MSSPPTRTTPAPSDAAAAAPGSWNKVELIASYFLLLVLLSVIGTRLSFATVWQLPAVDLTLSIVALLAIAAALWLGRHQRRWRIGVIAFATVSQLLPMVIRHPALLFPLLAALVPVAVLFAALRALSRKGSHNPRMD